MPRRKRSAESGSDQSTSIEVGWQVEPGYLVRSWMLVVPNEQEVHDTREEAEREKEQSDLLFPEDIHQIGEVPKARSRPRDPRRNRHM